MKGYRWWINTGALGRYEPNDHTFTTVELARYDAERNNGIPGNCYGIDYVDDNGDFINIIQTIQSTKMTQWIDDSSDDQAIVWEE